MQYDFNRVYNFQSSCMFRLFVQILCVHFWWYIKDYLWSNLSNLSLIVITQCKQLNSFLSNSFNTLRCKLSHYAIDNVSCNINLRLVSYLSLSVLLFIAMPQFYVKRLAFILGFQLRQMWYKKSLFPFVPFPSCFFFFFFFCSDLNLFSKVFVWFINSLRISNAFPKGLRMALTWCWQCCGL